MRDISPSGASNLGAAIAMLVLAAVSVFLRLIFRFSARQSPTLSDALIGLSLAFMVVYTAPIIHYVVNGPGPGTFEVEEILENVENGGLTWGVAMVKAVYICDIFFVATVSAAKLSILALYYSLFGISVLFQRLSQAMAVVVGLFFIIFTFVFVFQCHPVHALWDQMASTQYCMASGKITLAFELTNLFVDVGMLAMPPFMVSHLKLRKAQKWSVCGILLMGGMVCVVSMVRLKYIWNPANPQFLEVSPAMIASSVQLGVAILCACLPTYAPLLRFCRGGCKTTMKVTSAKTYGFGSSSRKVARGDNLISTSDSDHKLVSSPYYRVPDHSTSSKVPGESYTMESVGSDTMAKHSDEMT